MCVNSIFHKELSIQVFSQVCRYLYLLKHVLQLNQELLGIFSFVGDTVQGLGERTLQRHTDKKKLTSYIIGHDHITVWMRLRQ